MTQRTILLAIAFVLVVAGFVAVAMLDAERADTSTVRVVLASEVEWQALNPLRGDKSPRAGTLWGDRGAPVPCGFLVTFVDGFSSPPHIHPVTYRGVVVSGLVHNDDPEAEEQWLQPGAFWTQPAGEVHITAAKGTENVAYIEIEQGPYLVHPAEDAFERPEAPIKMPAADMAWTDSADGAKIATLPSNPDDDQLSRAFIKLPSGFEGTVRGGPTLHVVVIRGKVQHQVADRTDAEDLSQGSYFGSTGTVAHDVACQDNECLLYVRTDGTFELAAAQ